MHEPQPPRSNLFQKITGWWDTVSAFVVRLLFGVLRLGSGPAWNAQVFLFLVGAWIEWSLISQLFCDLQELYFPGNKLIHYVPASCAFVLVVHQFLIFRNAEVERERAIAFHAVLEHIKATGGTPQVTSPESPSRRVRLASYFLAMFTAFLLAAITGEVPYLLSLKFFTSDTAPAHSWVHVVDVLGVLPVGASWHAISSKQLSEALPLFYKTIFFGASIALACNVMAWDYVTRSTPSAAEKYPSPRIKTPVWKIFFASDFLSLVVWVCLFSTLMKVVDIKKSEQTVSDAMRDAVMQDILLITLVTLVYAWVIIRQRIFNAACSSESEQTIRDRIV